MAITSSELYSYCTLINHVSPSDSIGYQILNIVYKKVDKAIEVMDSSYKRGRWTTDLVLDQSKYLKQQPDEATNVFGQGKMKQVSIKREDDGDFVVCDVKDYDNLDMSIDYYKDGATQDNPFVMQENNAIYIYPEATETIVGGLKFIGEKIPYNVDKDSTEDLLIPVEFEEQIKEVIGIGFGELIYRAEGNKVDEVKDTQMFDKKLRKLKTYMRSTKQGLLKGDRMDLSKYE